METKTCYMYFCCKHNLSAVIFLQAIASVAINKKASLTKTYYLLWYDMYDVIPGRMGDFDVFWVFFLGGGLPSHEIIKEIV